eukprot:scaffold41617_cov75-Cyclotella_meneghiniana.AAC.2
MEPAAGSSLPSILGRRGGDVIVYAVYIIVKMCFRVSIDDSSATAVFDTAASSGRLSAIAAAGRSLSLGPTLLSPPILPKYNID